MSDSVYFIGAGFTKALQRSKPVPLMMDFVRVMTHYARTDDAVLMALIGLEAMRCYRVKNAFLRGLATAHNPKQYRWRLLWHIRRRTPESIERLLLAAERIESRINPLSAAGINAAIQDPVLRTQYAINSIFSAIAWELRLKPVARLLATRCVTGRHTFVSFNYDLAIERALEMARVPWSPVKGYGASFRFRTIANPSNLPGPTLIRVPRATGGITVLKPHGSLNWLLPAQGRYRSPVLATNSAGALRYIGSTPTHAYVRPPNHLPIRVAPFIVPPTREKNTHLSFLRSIRAREAAAIETADEIFLIGWSMPATDKDQVALIRAAVRQRQRPFERVVAVNYRAGDSYYRRVARILGVSLARVERFDNGVLEFADREVAPVAT
ncbi:MAG: hypothetical protein ACXW5U_07310 [Thermoanaerobaculia bacterium]